MQTGVTALRVATASHSTVRVVPVTAGRIVVDDPRIRDWTAISTSTATAMFPSAIASAATATATGNLTSGMTYYYAICAISGTARSLPSNMISYRASATTNQGIRFAWSGVAGVSAYHIFRTSAVTTGSANINFYGSSFLSAVSGVTAFHDTAA